MNLTPHKTNHFTATGFVYNANNQVFMISTRSLGSGCPLAAT